jgi:hypothetical protein
VSRVPGRTGQDRRDDALTSTTIPEVCFQNPKGIEGIFSLHRVCVFSPSRARSPPSSSSSESWSSGCDCEVSPGVYGFGISSNVIISTSLSDAKEEGAGEGGPMGSKAFCV